MFSTMETLGEVQALWRYPLKSLAPHALDCVEITRDGIPGDRSRALIVQSGHVREGKTYRGKEHNALHLLDCETTAIASARERGVDVLVGDQGPYFDAAPISLLFDRWLDEASALVGYPLEPQRYRPNIFVCASPEFCGAERDFAGLLLRAGTVLLRVRQPIGRCITTTYDQASGASDPAVLRQVALHRENFLGVYCDIESAGTLRVGDPVSIVPSPDAAGAM